MTDPTSKEPSRALLQSALESLDICVAVLTGPELRFTFMNGAYVRAAPRPPVIGARYRDVFVEDAKAGAEERLLHVLQTGERWNVERYPAPGRTPVTWWEGEVVRAETHGEEPSIVIFARDVSDQTRAEAAVLTANQKMNRTLETITDGTIVFDNDGRYLLVSGRAAGILRLRREDLLGLRVWDLYPKLRGSRFERAFLDAQKTGKSQRFEEFYPDLDAWLECSCDPSFDQLTFFFRDVTERRRSEEALRLSEARFRSMFDNVGVGMAHVGLDGRWLRVNGALSRILGYPREELLHKTFADITHPDDVQEDWTRGAQLLSGELEHTSMEKRYVRKDGSIIWANVTLTLDVEPATSDRYFISVIEDITERKATEDKLAEALRVRDDFLSIAGHELKTPLATLLLQVQSLSRMAAKGGPVPHLSDRLERAAASGLRLENLINQLLDVSRITAGRVQLEPEHLRLGDLVHNVLERFEETATKAGCRLELRVDADLEGVADRMRVEQIATNLVSNALKYGKGAPVEVELTTRGDRAVLRVTDHGIGIAPDQQHRIFERFERAVATREYGGFGLGLWIVRQLVELMGGSISVDSVVGKGATFRVELPLWSAPRDRHELH